MRIERNEERARAREREATRRADCGCKYDDVHA